MCETKYTFGSLMDGSNSPGVPQNPLDRTL